MRRAGHTAPSPEGSAASSSGAPGRAPEDAREEARAADDGEVLAAARAHEQFPTLMAALPTTPEGPRKPLTARERRHARHAFDHDLKEAKRQRREAERAERDAERDERKRYRGISAMLAERDRELSDRCAPARAARSRARGVYDAIGFDRMFRSGLAEVERGLYSESLAFTDASYQSASEASQQATFDAMAQLLAYFGPETCVQYSVQNEPVSADELERRSFFDERACGDNAELAAEFNQVLRDRLASGGPAMRRSRTLTYATAAPDPERAEVLLSRMRATATSQLEKAGASAHVLTGAERLERIASILRPGAPFTFDYDRDLSVRSPLTAKDFVCPTAIDFNAPGGDATCYVSEGTWCQVLVVRPQLASEICDRAISDICDLPMPLVVTWHLQPQDKAKSVSIVRRQAAWIQKEVIDQQKRALSQGYDHTILPPELEDMRSENERVLQQVLHASQRLYLFCGLVFTYGATRAELDARVVEIVRTAHAAGIELATLPLRQREGMNSVLPLAHCHVDVRRDLTTAEATILMPFTTQELDVEGGGYYGQNRISGNIVVCNRKRLMSPHGFVCGMSGSGKSFAVKREITNTILANPADEVHVMDVTGEYGYLTEALHGTRVVLGPDSASHLNPLDLGSGGGIVGHAALAWKVDALLAMASALKAEGGADLTQEERSVVAMAAEACYRDSDTPTLGDFAAALEAVGGPGEAEAARLALVFSRYVSGPLGFLNHETDVEVGSCKLTCYDTSDVPADMRVLAMLANLEGVRRRMLANHVRGVATWLYIDEVQSLFGHPAIISYLARLWREGRKFGLVCTGMTQSAAAMAAGGEASSIVDQSGFLLLMRQSDADRAFWAEAKSLSPVEEGYISETCGRGQGLLIADGARIGVADDFPRDTRLYEIFSTSPEDHARAEGNRRRRRRGRGRR